ncbi:hypothetical protein L208DRAFT_1401823, partial [Tricholoma matsutake]
MVYERLRPYLKEIQEIAPGERWACVTGKAERKQANLEDDWREVFSATAQRIVLNRTATA